MTSAPALEVERVSHAFGARKALDDVSLVAPSGAFTALLGQNGAGKTTLFSLVTRLYQNASGAIRVEGFDVRRTPSQALARLGVVFQARTLDLELTVMQNLQYHAALHGIGGREARGRARALLERFGLADRAGERVRSLSGGQMRRVEIARALLHGPSLLLLDEPTVGLDIGSRRALLAETRRLIAEDGVGVLWATHLVDEIEAADGVVALHQGRVAFSGDVAGLKAQGGADDVGAAFLALVEPGASRGHAA
ncbi:ABC transporter ATP-binding protein [Methylopila jiangsuensis]|uniref:ABC transporter ATP-binding protein n=1 Tax=Methylopila jiangsuensis TaxID=586230 RepID=A0A9W6JEL4_9HYPH|nr:ABC transporter ATP-binding protein [Methylopila jiangsuensis]MDR6285819.1 ABC-2 type transport system ATP-binding protein [Methylopila jiangsuensis]GLK75577.1 ABC transporter ATP-binding protein [Methylopila jiangsuensis]